ncbi:MAG: hypothetical protein Q4F21_13185, partial [Lachnospiraceae bacterium]|nr:hypothetical protein [Lachnospiraceae bacterium]
MANTTLELLAGLNLSASEKQIAADIQVLQKRLEAAGIGKIKLTGEIDKELLKAVQDMAKSGGLASAGKNLGEELATNLINSFNIKSKDAQKQIKSLSKSLFRMSVGEARSGTENPAFLSTMNYLGKVVETNANIIQQRMGIYDDFYNYFQKLGKIKIPDIVKSDLGKDWDDMRKAAAGKFVTNKPGIELDSIYQEMAGKYKDIFSGTADQTQQFREIVSTLKAYQADIGKMKPLDAAGIEDF